MTGPALLECVPNFSEGRNNDTLDAIAAAIRGVPGVSLLHVDPGASTNRTVMTFAGPPDSVAEAAFQAIRVAADQIDMRRHHGEHPRLGATDVCPLVPISGIDMNEVVALSRSLGERVGRELGIPVFLYEHAATRPERTNLASIRAGEYEGLAEKLSDPAWQPDFGPASFNPRAGATVIGARDFLVAYNINLNTTSVRRANAVAFDLREQGRVKKSGPPTARVTARGDDGEPLRVPGRLKAVKAIGWFIPEYGFAQVSMNLTNLALTPLHAAFDEACKAADERGLRVTGSELVGLVPRQVLLDAGRHYLRKQRRSAGVPEAELIRTAVRSLGLSEIRTFNPRERVIEYLVDGGPHRLGDMVQSFADEVASESPTPGGGSVAAVVGALGAALGTMVANLSAAKPGWEARWESFSDLAEAGEAAKRSFLRLADEDAAAFDRLMAAHRLEQGTPEAASARAQAVHEATLAAMATPLAMMRLAAGLIELLEQVATQGLLAAVSDAGSGGLCVRTAAEAAHLNVKINAAELNDAASDAMLAEADRLAAEIGVAIDRILSIVASRLNDGA